EFLFRWYPAENTNPHQNDEKEDKCEKACYGNENDPRNALLGQISVPTCNASFCFLQKSFQRIVHGSFSELTKYIHKKHAEYQNHSTKLNNYRNAATGGCFWKIETRRLIRASIYNDCPLYGG
ncbi:MAG TPA: hypothetical protein VF141_10975, partial [Chryseolinea sp.]